DEVMSGFEYSAAAAMVQAGLLKEGFAVVRAAADRYDGRLRTGLSDAAWGYSGNPFCDDECGKFYARPMSIWSMLLACQGFIYDGPAGVIGFRPVWKPENHRSFFGAAEGWGLFVQDRDGRKQTDRIEVRYGRLELASLVFELPDGVEPSNVVVEVAGERVLASHVVRDGRLLITLPARMTVSEGEAVAVSAQ
ncbi:MAG: glucosylceramidase, partial [Armatimonadota bacterium]